MPTCTKHYVLIVGKQMLEVRGVVMLWSCGLEHMIIDVFFLILSGFCSFWLKRGQERNFRQQSCVWCIHSIFSKCGCQKKTCCGIVLHNSASSFCSFPPWLLVGALGGFSKAGLQRQQLCCLDVQFDKSDDSLAVATVFPLPRCKRRIEQNQEKGHLWPAGSGFCSCRFLCAFFYI